MSKQRLQIICAKGLDNFIDDIIINLSNDYQVKKFIITNQNDIFKAIDWADIVWFEWANEVAIIGSNYYSLSKKPAIIRLHSYEALVYFPTQINWKNIDNLIFVAPHILDIVKSYIPNIEDLVNTNIIYNGVNLSKYTYKKRNKGFNIAWVANINYKKNPALIIQIMDKLVKINPRYKLHIAGAFQDLRYKVYFDYIIKKMSLQDNIIFYGWVDDINKWWEDKNYLLSTSIHESFGYNIAEAMAKGIKPIIHNFMGSEELFIKNTIYNNIDEAVNLITEDTYESEKYRKFIEDNYFLENQISKIKKLLNNLRR